MAGAPTRENIQHFWKTVYEKTYTEHASGRTREKLLEAIDQLADMFSFREHMVVVELNLDAIFRSLLTLPAASNKIRELLKSLPE